ncbi:tsr1 [Nucleospora cyclopteri]
MKNHDKKNRQNQKIANKKLKDEKFTTIYKNEGYRVISTVYLDQPLKLELKLPYNFIKKDFICKSTDLLEMSLITRCSDLIIVVVNGDQIDIDHVNILKRFLPSVIVVYGKNEYKIVAKSISKLLGDVKISNLTLLNNLLKRFQFKNTKICNSRPFMVVKSVQEDGGKTILEGFMKKGLISDKLIINGQIEAIIEEICVGENFIRGEDINCSEDKADFVETTEVYDVKDQESSENEEFEEDLEQLTVNFDYNEIEDEKPYVDLIEKYKDFKGIKNLESCKFSISNEPEYYKGLKFFKKYKHLENRLIKKERKIKDNKFIKIKLNKLVKAENIVAFNLYEYETHPTIMNYQFSNSQIIQENIFVDNGIRIFNTKSLITENDALNAFTVKPGFLSGVISFLAPVTFFSKTAYIYPDSVINSISLLEGFSEKREFLDHVTFSGYPLKIFKTHIVVKGMFCNADQVKYFSGINLEANNGNKGYIKKSLGTKGNFKAFFVSPIKHGEEIKMKLYKRRFLLQ